MTVIKGYVVNIEKASLENENYRKVLYTAKHSQLVLMCLLPGEDIGEEIHELDQFIRCEAGEGKVIINGITHEMNDGTAIIVPEGAKHNVINTSSKPLKLYTIYSPPHHKDGLVHKTKAEADADQEDHFDGDMTEW